MSEKTTTIKWGILGTSYISEVMANAIQASETSQLVAIGSRSLTTAKNFSNKFSIFINIRWNQTICFQIIT